jgi:hypothetical protein
VSSLLASDAGIVAGGHGSALVTICHQCWAFGLFVERWWGDGFDFSELASECLMPFEKQPLDGNSKLPHRPSQILTRAVVASIKLIR